MKEPYIHGQSVNIAKLAVLSKVFCRLSVILFKIPGTFFKETERKNPKIHREVQQTPQS
jgi:hypothetical protein